MKKQTLIAISIAMLTTTTQASTLRCGQKLVKPKDSTNALIKKCGNPVRKYSSKQDTNIQGRSKRVSVSNWIYERRGKKDMIVSIHDGTIINIEVE